MQTFDVRTHRRNELVDITSQVEKIVRESGVKSGICVVCCPHTTAAVTVNENADPDVGHDILMGLEKIVPHSWPYRHGEGNSDAHIKSSIVGCSQTMIVRDASLVLGTWQGIYFCEFDGPRTRRVHVQAI
ncbi:YjbQ family protein [Candidatus Sumerlaeota bacterium]|nr:YjbQ family protein [Candidatus Sumerlaeota bacterium]